MKRFVSLFLALALLSILPAGHAEDELTSVEAVSQLLQQGKEEGKTELTFNCSKELYKALSDERNKELYRLCYQAGILEPNIRTSVTGTVMLEKIQFSDSSVFAEPATLEEAQEAVTAFVKSGVNGFTLLCTPELYTALSGEKAIYPMLSRLGIGEFQLSGSKQSGFLYVRKMKPFAGAWCFAKDAIAAGEQIAAWHQAGKSAFTVVFDQETFQQIGATERRVMEFIGGIDDLYLAPDSTLTLITGRNALQQGMTGTYSYICVEGLGCLSIRQ